MPEERRKRARLIVAARFAAFVSATAMLTASQAPPRIRTFTQTADGNWRTSVKGPDGKDVEWVTSRRRSSSPPSRPS